MLIPVFSVWMVGLASTLGANSSTATMSLCTIAKPFVWHRDEDTSSASAESSTTILREKRNLDGSTGVKSVDEFDPVVAKGGFFGRLFSD